MSETRRTPSATVNPSSDLLDLLARWTDLNNLTVLEVLWFVICSHLDDGIGDDMDKDFEDEWEEYLQCSAVGSLMVEYDGMEYNMDGCFRYGTKQLVDRLYCDCDVGDDLCIMLQAMP